MNRATRRFLTALAVVFVSIGATAGDDSALAPLLRDLEGLMSQERCPEVLDRLAELEAPLEGHVDLLVIEANCLLASSRSIRREVDARHFEELRLALGGKAVPADLTQRLEELELRFDPQAAARALRLLERAQKAAPDRSDLVIGRIAVLIDLGRLDEALRVLRAAAPGIAEREEAELAGLVRDLLRTHRGRLAMQLADALIALRPDSPNLHAARAAAALHELEGREAIESLRHVTRARPTDIDISVRLARLLLLAREPEAVPPAVYEVAPRDVDAKLALALARGTEHPASASPLWVELDAATASSAAAQELREIVIKHYKRLGASGRLPSAAMRLRGAHYFLERSRPLEAAVEAAAATIAEPGMVEAWLFLAERQRQALLLDFALESFDGALAAAREGDSPMSPEAIELERGRILLGLRRYEEAEKAFAGAKSLDTRFERALAAMGRGKERAARKLLEELVSEGGEGTDRAKARLAELE